MGFISFILTVIFAIWLLGRIGGFFLRRFLRRAQVNFEQQFDESSSGGYYRQQYTRSSRDEAAGREGDVRITSASSYRKEVNGEVGDYVDFEEL